jgi:microsomal dipeptidase-like Zn-dependent dipeptidase
MNYFFMYHSIDHINRVKIDIGIDHVGIGADFDGVSEYLINSLKWRILIFKILKSI